MFGPRLCGAPLSPRQQLARGHMFCRARAITGRTRCRYHGGCTTGPKTPEGKARMVAAAGAGRRRWVEMMREKKRMGEIERFPGGSQKGDPKRRPGEPKEVAKARRVIARLAPPAGPPQTPWPQQTKDEKLSTVTDLGLDIVRQILELGVNPTNPRWTKLVQETALTVISQQIRVDETKLRGPSAQDGRRRQVLAELAQTMADKGYDISDLSPHEAAEPPTHPPGD